MSAGHATRVHVWHRPDGEIIAWGRLEAGLPFELGIVPLAEAGAEVIESEVDADLLDSLHETHTVDIGSRTLVERGLSGES